MEGIEFYSGNISKEEIIKILSDKIEGSNVRDCLTKVVKDENVFGVNYKTLQVTFTLEEI